MPHPMTSPTLDHFRDRLRQLRRDLDAAQPLDRDRLVDEINSFEVILEEVQVAEEELLLQNEELVRAQESFETERLRFLNLFEFAPDAFLVTDLAGVVREANKAASDLLATSRKALRGKPLAVFVADDKRPVFRDALHRLGLGERLEPWEVALKPRGGGPPVPVVLNAALQPQVGGQPGGLLWTARDVSASRAAEEALRDSEERLRHAQRMEAVGRLAGGIAHSFNNLLAAMAFHGELLAEGIDGDQNLAGHLHEVQEAIERGASLASQLLAFSRKQVLQPRVMRLNEVITAMEPMLQQLIGHQVALQVRIDPEAGAVFADPAQLEQVLLNLVVNARDAMPEGGRLVLKTAHAYLAASGAQDLPPGHYACLVVEDSGTGMSEAVQARLFEPFFTTKGPDKGTGLGLSTVYGIVRQSGGNVRVESAPGRGSRFEVYLPRVTEAAETPAAVPGRRREPRGRTGGSEVVLLVEDEDNIREPACEILEGRGYTVLAARNGAEALELAARHAGPIHLLVSDVVMPGMNGRQLAVEISHVRPEAKVLLMSGYPEPAVEGMADGMASGEAAGQEPFPAWTLLQKPFPPRLLLDRIREVLDHSPPPEQHHDAA
jgi:two-component system, cell cycle sensor histidine kinase and response regulator CckA